MKIVAIPFEVGQVSTMRPGENRGRFWKELVWSAIPFEVGQVSTRPYELGSRNRVRLKVATLGRQVSQLQITTV